jgi:transcriptional regulator with XRE-family HTH domain
MLTLSNLRLTRVAKRLTRHQLAHLSDISNQRLRELELRDREPWFDEALTLSQILRTTLPALIASESLTLCDLGPSLPTDTAIWRSGARCSLSLACRVARAFGLDDPAFLTCTDLTRQVWEVIGANDRHPEHGGLCPWCIADIAMGEPHLATCLPANLWGPHVQPDTPLIAAAPAVRPVKAKGIPALNLRVHRVNAGRIQKEISDVLGINVNYYARLERGDGPLSPAHAATLAAYYGVDRALLYRTTEGQAQTDEPQEALLT